ncbi:hypothetical protein Prudu_014041 [Prunus dulcis]|uniref:Uncharacterized protein n=1 Tax=Prunus dulcis TaxID=3755 RepID=A0A4Y1RGN5_PRUDU|nr:hypothetical protein Prudu_014041 [Prunus dulcis]
MFLCHHPGPRAATRAGRSGVQSDSGVRKIVEPRLQTPILGRKRGGKDEGILANILDYRYFLFK